MSKLTAAVAVEMAGGVAAAAAAAAVAVVVVGEIAVAAV
jgi:hypothetical protein